MAEEKKVENKPQSDEELIFAFQNDNMQAYNELVKRYKDPLFNFIYRYMNDYQQSEDLLQETFLRLYKNKHYYKEVAKFSTWIYTIAGNLAKTELRRRKRRNIFSINNYTRDERDFELVDENRTPDEEIESNNITKHIHDAMAKLPEVFKEVLLLRDVQGLEYDEIAEITKTPLGTVKSRINRGRAKLAAMLKYIM